ncbi:response regulator [Adhaeribacter aquaticus]|uniref:response regulator n=1 Tax=Adhaeribacter aquaticus TaxID=299567 RepID=UPI0003F7B6B3|nr:response regulator [Adhaeribacter aquaticus]
MKNNTIRYLIVVFGFTLVLLLISSVASYISINRLVSSSNFINKANAVSLQLETIVSNIKDAETGFRGFAITQDSSFLEPYNGAYNRAMENFSHTQNLTAENPVQQNHLRQLKPLIDKRFAIWERALNGEFVIGNRRRIFNEGKVVMDQIRALVDKMEEEEASLISNQNQSLKKYITATPVLVLSTAFITVLITLLAFFRIRSDFRKSQELQQQLELSAETMKERVTLISDMVKRISEGDYQVRIEDREKAGMGVLADALNRMASDLQKNQEEAAQQDWLRKGYIELNDQLKGEKSPQQFSQHVLTEMAKYLNGKVGLFYMLDDTSNLLNPTASYACSLEANKNIAMGEGLVGQAALDKAPVVLTNVPDNLVKVNSGLLEGPPTTIIIHPLIYNDEVQGVLELGLMGEVTEIESQYLYWCGQNVANALVTAKNRWRVHDLLQETQAQAEELQVQQEELQRSNAELEMQSQKLQASEEELRVQQEELLQSNQELEEKAQILEEKNQFIDQKSRELVQLYKSLEEKNRELEQASRYKSEFLANMSHELRTPLNSILLLAKLLADSKDLDLGDDRYEYARVIHSSGIGLLELINEILDLSKIEAGQMQISIEEVPFVEIKQDLIAMFNPLAKEKGLELVLDFDATLPHSFKSDKSRLEQILKNLLSNAIKFTESGQVSLEVSRQPVSNVKFINSQLNQVEVIAFKVTDTGIGIPLEKQALVFEAFKQVDGSSRRKYGGTGLGLSISREIAKLLGGEIQLESEPGKGSTFTLYLPIYLVDEKDQTLEIEAQPASPAKELIKVTKALAGTGTTKEDTEATNSPAPVLPYIQVPDDRDFLNPQDKAILIVEDDIPFVKALIPFVRSNGYKALVATRGDEGVLLARKYQPVGILLDINLPVMDGWSVMEQLKQDFATRHIPVHTMSSDEARRKSLNLGAIDFISKPLAEKELNQVLHRIEEVGQKTSRMLLIIENHQKHADALSQYFQENNIQTTVALSGEEGLSLLKKEPFDSVILDISVDEKVAFSLLDQIKSDKRFETVPVIVYTGHTITTEDEKRINQYAATSIVRKANTYEKLLNEVSIFLHLVQENQEGNTKEKRRNKLIDRDLAGKTILIADDDARNIFSLSKVLQNHEVNVITAANGKEVMAYLEKELHLDAILIDIMMPEMDGYETATAIRKNSRYKNIPIIAVTAKTMPNDRNKCIEAGASDYIAKPVDIDQLLSLLRVWMY